MRGTKDLTVGNERKLIIQFTIPMLIGSLFQQMYNVVDSLIVGNFIGKNALAAVGVSFPIIFLLISLLIGLTIGLSILVSQYFGAKDIKKVKEAIDTIYISLFVASLIITAFGLLFSRELMQLLAVPAEIENDSVLYFSIFTGGLVFLFGFNATNAILRGLGDTKTPLYFLIISTVLNLILDVVFVGVIGLGVEWVAIATVFSQFVAFIAAIIYLNKRHPIVHLSLRHLKFNKEIFRQSLKMGIPSGLQQSFVAIGILALFRIVNEFGTDAMAAFTIASRLDSFAAMPAMILASALSNFVGQNMGAGKLDRISKGYRETVKISVVIAVSVSIILVSFRTSLISVFNQDPQVIEIGSHYLMIVGFFYLVYSLLFVNQSVLRGAGDAITPMLITLVALWIVRIPISWWLSRTYGTDGIWWGIPIAWGIGFALSQIFYLRGRWKKKSLVNKKPEVIADGMELLDDFIVE
jgi:putative MATE family efflux protein